MLKYIDTKVVFREVPNEISLAINISGCPIKCEDCHSKYLWEDKGKPLTQNTIKKLFEKNDGITCFVIMGGDADVQQVVELAKFIKIYFERRVKVAWYSGQTSIDELVNNNLQYFDFIKIGPFIKEFGPLNSRKTNQTMYEIMHLIDEKGRLRHMFLDITHLFWK